MTSSTARPDAGSVTRMRRVAAAPLPVALAVTGVLLTGLAAYVDTLTTAAERDVVHAGRGALTAVTGTVLMVSAAVILRSRPRHRVGIVLGVFGLVWAVDGLLESWSALAFAEHLPGVDIALWFVARFGSVLLLGLPLLLVLYPTGSLMEERWRVASLATVVAAAGLPVMLLLAPDDVVFRDDLGVPGVDTELLSLPLPEDVVVGLLVVTRFLTLLALLGALVIAFVRHRRADGLQRTQLRWLLWAGIVCLLVIPVVVVAPSGTITGLVLAVAVVLTAVSVTVGVVRPDIADVDALVAGTLTYAGVAGLVVALDLLTLTAGGSLLGDRLDERNVTLVVLVLAVAVYGPLRTWVGAAVRRVLFGRRGDRYDVVSAFAARLEETRSVDEQLPALAGAVASTFKVPFVRVELYTPDGGTVSASHGQPTQQVSEIDIAYTGERIGRLVLPVNGVRSMLSRRDQGLLVDLVRQAAIAMRSSLLAAEVQESRERLVLGREDDRRRIRRDLHDGLGPALGGVAMRLDAAGNAVGSDPERARELVRLARTEVREALDDVRRLVHDLRPPALDDLGLAAALEQQAERVRSSLEVSVAADGVTGLPAAVEVAAYRIVSESLANVVKHAGATRCAITLEREAGALSVEVRDDGRGIAADVTAGVGLLSLRERAEELGGRCEVSCPEGGGTRVWAWLPLGQGTAVEEDDR